MRQIRRRGTTLAATTLIATSMVAVSAPAEATQPGPNGRIVYAIGAATTGAWTIRSVCADGTAQRAIATDAQSPAVSADGSKIAYDFGGPSSDLAKRGIWTVDADGSNRRRLSTEYNDGNPAWSPDGSKLAITRSTPYPGVTGRIQVTLIDAATGGGAVSLINTSSYHDMAHTTWTPDGTWIYATAKVGSSSAPRSIVRVRATGGDPEVVLPAGSAYSYNHIDIDPSGTRLLVGRQSLNAQSSLNVTDIVESTMTGGAPRTLYTYPTFNSTDSRSAVGYSPDGSRIVFEAQRGSSYSLATALPDGSGEQWLATYGSVPRWSADVSGCGTTPPSPSHVDLKIVEVMLAAGGDRRAQYIELLAPKNEPTLDQPYRLVVFDAGGRQLRSQTLPTRLLPPQRRAGTPILVGTSAADRALRSTRDETLGLSLPAVGQLCLTRGSAQTRRNCVTWGCAVKPVSSPQTTAIAYPTTTRSSQRQGVGSASFRLAAPTPGRANTNGSTGSACLTLALASPRTARIAGKPRAGKKLSVVGTSPRAWNVPPTSVRYRWYRGNRPIRGATKATYRVKKADRGKRLTVRVTATASGLRTGVVAKKIAIKR